MVEPPIYVAAKMTMIAGNLDSMSKPTYLIIILFSVGYQCDQPEHRCNDVSGRIRLDSIRIKTSFCVDCKESNEGVIMKLLGEKNGDYPGGVPCQTNILDHKESRDFVGETTIFNGRKNGTENEDETNMMGSCYEVTQKYSKDNNKVFYSRPV